MYGNSKARRRVSGTSWVLVIGVGVVMWGGGLGESWGQTGDTVTIRIDYTYDDGFFGVAGSAEREALEMAANYYETLLGDSLAATGTFDAVISHPSYDPFDPFGPPLPTVNLDDFNVDADVIVIFVGSSSSLSGAAVSSLGGGDFTERETDPDDFEPWGGSITFNSGYVWSADAGGPLPGTNDLYSYALHEIGHILGVGTSPEWEAQVASGMFDSPETDAAYGGDVPVSPDGFHFGEGVTSPTYGGGEMQDALFDPTIAIGTRETFTEVDIALLEALGWEIVPEPGVIGLVMAGAGVLWGARRRRPRQ